MKKLPQSFFSKKFSQTKEVDAQALTLPIPGIKLGPIELGVDAGLFWNVLDLQLNAFTYSQTSIRPGFYLGAGLGIYPVEKVGLLFQARYGWMFVDRERISATDTIKISMDYATYYAGVNIRI